jgi:putative nucleotidyltransferase with HDIG domain
MTVDLELILQERSDMLNIKKSQQEILKKYLQLLKDKDKNTYDHSLRVSFLCHDIAQNKCIDNKAMFYAGLLHDTGKYLVDEKLLNKKDFNNEDYEKIRDHVLNGYKMLNGTFEFTSQIIVRHHRFQKDPYPQELPETKINFGSHSEVRIEYYALLLSMADFYDALISRKNSKFTDKTERDNESIKSIYEKCNPSFKEVFNNLIDDAVLTRRYLE